MREKIERKTDLRRSLIEQNSLSFDEICCGCHIIIAQPSYLFIFYSSYPCLF